MAEPSQRFRVCIILLSLIGMVLAPVAFQQEAALHGDSDPVFSQQTPAPVQNSGEETRRRTTGAATVSVMQRLQRPRTARRMAWSAAPPPCWRRVDIHPPLLRSHPRPASPRAPPCVC